MTKMIFAPSNTARTRNIGLAALSSLMVMTACTGDTNPETASLFDNISNLNSGEYESQIAARQARIDALSADNAQAQQRVGSLVTQRNSNDQQLAALRAEIAAARAEADRLRQSLPSGSAGLARLVSIEAQIDSVEQAANSGGDVGSLSTKMIEIRQSLQALEN